MTAAPSQVTSAARSEAQAAATGHRLGGPELTQANFVRIATIAHEAAGLAIGAGKSAMVRTRLTRRLRALGLPSFDAYCRYLDGAEGPAEVGMLVSALTTNVSHFFREKHHFDTLRSQVLPSLAQRARAGERVRLWSAGCANGQEPYSILMTMIEAGMPLDRDVRLLATDIDPSAVEHARNGAYPDAMLSGLPDPLRDRYFVEGPTSDGPRWRARDALREAVQFRLLNLLDDWPMRGQFDAIFCRNVVIYFDAETQDRLWQRFARQLAPDGWLFIGHSERLSRRVQPQFSGRGITVFQHVDRTRGVAGQPGVSHGRI